MDALDTLASPRSKFIGMQSRELHNSGRFNACLVRAGIVVQSHRTGTGKLLPADHPQFGEYLEAFETSLDSTESDALCKALIV